MLNQKDIFCCCFNNREAVQILFYQEAFEIIYSVVLGDKMQGISSLYESRDRLILWVWISFAQILFETINIWFRIYKIIKS